MLTLFSMYQVQNMIAVQQQLHTLTVVSWKIIMIGKDVHWNIAGYQSFYKASVGPTSVMVASTIGFTLFCLTDP